MEVIREKILAADILVFAAPLYYYGMSAPLKTMIDRFCAFNGSIQRKHMKSALLAVAWNSDDWTFEALEAHYKALVRYAPSLCSWILANLSGCFISIIGP